MESIHYYLSAAFIDADEVDAVMGGLVDEINANAAPCRDETGMRRWAFDRANREISLHYARGRGRMCLDPQALHKALGAYGDGSAMPDGAALIRALPRDWARAAYMHRAGAPPGMLAELSGTDPGALGACLGRISSLLRCAAHPKEAGGVREAAACCAAGCRKTK